MKDRKNPNTTASELSDSLEDKYSRQELVQLASTLFQRNLELKKKNRWSSAEDDMIRTFFYLSSKEELCEALYCDMESLYKRARYLGVVSQSFQTITSFDLGLAISLFASGDDQETVLDKFGITSISVPVKSLTMNEYTYISSSVQSKNSAQMELFDED